MTRKPPLCRCGIVAPGSARCSGQTDPETLTDQIMIRDERRRIFFRATINSDRFLPSASPNIPESGLNREPDLPAVASPPEGGDKTISLLRAVSEMIPPDQATY